ncbi:MAG TPA: transposase [Gemmatimonadales bacterium]|nr:transposase [Gemmatimonadales bacterium]
MWALVMGHVLREDAFAGVEALVRSRARRALQVCRRFGDDALAYFTERLDAAPTRQALARVLRWAKRRKVFAASLWIGVAVDGTTTTCYRKRRCAYCRPLRKHGTIVGYRHHVVLLSVVGTLIPLPCDVELYGPGDSEYVAAQRGLRRVVAALGARFADYVVADGEFATAPFLHTAGALGLRVVARLKDNLPGLAAAARQRYASIPPTGRFTDRDDQVEVWDAADFPPWPGLRWAAVRVLLYRQTKPDGRIIEAMWLTDWPQAEVSSQALYRMAKSRWSVENEGFNVAKTLHGMEHLCHHHTNSIVVNWLLLLLALTIERLYRLRYLHRGAHRVRTAIQFVRDLRISLGLRPVFANSG